MRNEDLITDPKSCLKLQTSITKVKFMTKSTDKATEHVKQVQTALMCRLVLLYTFRNIHHIHEQEE